MSTPRPNYGITRIDQPEKKNHGFYVRITHLGKTHQKYFPDKSSGGRAKALRLAREHRSRLLSKMPRAKQEAAARKPRKILRSGVVGVTHVVSRGSNGKNYEYWQAAWIDPNGKRRTAKYSIGRYGKETALELAKRARKSKTRVAAPAIKKRAGRKR
jgi:hypothetical protein